MDKYARGPTEAYNSAVHEDRCMRFNNPNEQDAATLKRRASELLSNYEPLEEAQSSQLDGENIPSAVDKDGTVENDWQMIEDFSDFDDLGAFAAGSESTARSSSNSSEGAESACDGSRCGWKLLYDDVHTLASRRLNDNKRAVKDLKNVVEIIRWIAEHPRFLNLSAPRIRVTHCALPNVPTVVLIYMVPALTETPHRPEGLHRLANCWD